MTQIETNVYDADTKHLVSSFWKPENSQSCTWVKTPKTTVVVITKKGSIYIYNINKVFKNSRQKKDP